ncbi:MAG: hypothetical protein LIP11_01615 [Clostridiales bacterium]|nr:hypothetical protein [Clostridiales bacterium]
MNETVNESTLGRKELLDQRAQELAKDFSFEGYQGSARSCLRICATRLW